MGSPPRERSGDRSRGRANNPVLAMRFFVRTRAMSKPSQKPRRQKPDLRQINPAVAGRSNHDRTRRTKRKQNAERRCCLTAALSARRAACKSALASRRSTAALVQGTHASQGLSLGPGFAEHGAKNGRGLPPAPAPVAASTSRAGHGAGRHDVRSRPGATVTNPCPRAPHPALPAGVTGWPPCKEARRRRSTPRATIVKYCRGGRDLFIDLTALFAGH